MTDVRNCSTCIYWRAGASTDMTMAARDESYEDVGACENIVPQVFIVGNRPETLQPIMHRTRCCAEWREAWPDDDEDGPDGGEPVPEPEESRVRQLFPIRDVAA
jgi:hypothetical protein